MYTGFIFLPVLIVASVVCTWLAWQGIECLLDRPVRRWANWDVDDEEPWIAAILCGIIALIAAPGSIALGHWLVMQMIGD